jgi:hypothetical protein
MTRRCSFLGVLASVASIAVAQASTAEAAQFRCPVRGAKVLAASQHAVVYEGPNAEDETEVFGCARGLTRRYAFGMPQRFSSSGGGGVAHEGVAGVFAAYEQSSSEPIEPPYHGASVSQLIVRNLETGRVTHKVPTAPVAHENMIGRGPVFQLALDASGAIGWIVIGHSVGEYEVRAVDRTGEHVLASGSGIAPHSLELRGNRLSWSRTGKRSSYTLH